MLTPALYVQACTSIMLLVAFWGAPGLPMPAGWAFPFPSHPIDIVEDSGFAIGPVAWVSVCQIVSRRSVPRIVTKLLDQYFTKLKQQ